MKIAHLTTVDMSLRFLLLPQLTAVVDAGGEAIGISAPGPWVDELEARGIRHVELTSSTRGVDWRADLRAAFELWRILKAERPDVLHTHNPKPGVYGRIVGRLAGVPVVVNTVHGFYATETDPWLKRLVVYGLEFVAARFSDFELFQNPEDLALARRLRLVSSRKSELLGNGVDLSRFGGSIDRDTRASVRAEFGVEDDTPVIGIVGRLVAEKGYPELFRAIELIDAPVRLVVVGPDDPDKPDALDRDVVDRARRSGVTFLGMRNDVDRLYTGFDVFVLPSHREGFPRSAMEAAAAGLPLVVTDIRGCRQVVTDGVNGLVVPVRSPEALASALTTLITDSELRRRFGAASAERAATEFDERRVVDIVFDTHLQLLAERGARPDVDPDGAQFTVAEARRSDCRQAGRLHAESIRTGFLSSLGPGFLGRLYMALAESPHSGVFVARDDHGRVVGFVAGTRDTAATYRSFLRSRHALLAGVAALRALVRPSTWIKVIETLRYGGDTHGPPAELLAMAVVEQVRGRGVGERLGRALLGWWADESIDQARVVVGAENEGAIAFYRRLGFEGSHEMALHDDAPSVMMTWSR